MAEVTTTVDEVESRDTAKSTVYRVKTPSGEYATFDRDLGIKAGTLRGQTVTITYTEKQVQKGDKTYTNRYLEAIEAARGITQEQAAAAIATGQASYLSDSSNPTSDPPSPTSKDVSIARAVALKAAVDLAVGLGDPDVERILITADDYVEWLLTGELQRVLPPTAQTDDVLVKF